MANKFCIQCGAPFSEGARFCPTCGAAREQGVAVPPQPSVEQSIPVTQPLYRPQSAPTIAQPTYEPPQPPQPPEPPQYDYQPPQQPVPPQYDYQPPQQPVPPQYDYQPPQQPVPPQYDYQPPQQPVPPQYDYQPPQQQEPPQYDYQPPQQQEPPPLYDYQPAQPQVQPPQYEYQPPQQQEPPPQHEYQPPQQPVPQQYDYQPPQQAAQYGYQPQPQVAAKPKKQRKVPLFVKILIAVVLAGALVAGGILIFAKITLDNLGKAEHYEIGSDKVPSLHLAFGGRESCKLTGFSTSVSTSGVNTNVYFYSADGASDGMVLYEYAEYLVENDDFDFLTDGSFSKSTGEAVQIGRNSEESGYMLVLQFDWKPGEYVITVMRGKGTVKPLEKEDPPPPQIAATAAPPPEETLSPPTETSTEPIATPIVPETPTPGNTTGGDIDAWELLEGGLFRWIQSGEYYYRFEAEDSDGAVTSGSFATRDGAVAMTVTMEGEAIRMVQEDGAIYYIMDNQGILYIMSSTDIAMLEAPDLSVSEILDSGMGTLQGRTLPFVTFKTETDGSTMTAWFEGTTVCAIESAGELVVIVESSPTAPDEMFEVPEDYIVYDTRIED